MMRKIKYRRAGVAGLLFMTVMSACFLTGCVDQHPEGYSDNCSADGNAGLHVANHRSD